MIHSAQANSDPFSSHIPDRLRTLGLPAEHTARADSDPSVQSRHMTLTTATPQGPGYIPSARVHAPAGQAQSSTVAQSQAEDPAGNRRSSLQLLQGLRWSTMGKRCHKCVDT